LGALLSLASCSHFNQTETAENQATEFGPQQGAYFDFSDVKTPGSMTLDRDESFVYETNSVRAGVLALSGSASMEEILAFYEDHMPRDGWTMLSSFKYQKNVLIFTKTDKVCLITTHRPNLLSKTALEVWVAPVRPGQTVPMDGLSPIVGNTLEPLPPNTEEPLPLAETALTDDSTLELRGADE
jgi:hypothetical protein